MKSGPAAVCRGPARCLSGRLGDIQHIGGHVGGVGVDALGVHQLQHLVGGAGAAELVVDADAPHRGGALLAEEGADSLARMNGYMASQFMGSAVQGVSSGDAIALVEQIADEVLPEGYAIEWIGQAWHEKRIGSSSSTAFGFGLIIVFLILAALYERWSLPIAVMLAVPFAVLGALVSLWIRSAPNDIYFQIGLLVLIGLTAKNAILIVEFAVQKMQEGMNPFDAALEAAHLRLRPILMTSLAFVLGVMPLVFATGAGAQARHSMGTGVFGGMIAATFIATIFVPVFFTWLARGKKHN